MYVVVSTCIIHEWCVCALAEMSAYRMFYYITVNLGGNEYLMIEEAKFLFFIICINALQTF